MQRKILSKIKKNFQLYLLSQFFQTLIFLRQKISHTPKIKGFHNNFIATSEQANGKSYQ